MKLLVCSIGLLAVAFLTWSVAANAVVATGPRKPPFDELVGIWAEDCRGTKPVIVITPEYHAIVNDPQDTGRAIGLGKIERFEIDGDEITFFFSTSFLHQTGEAKPRYKISGKNEIIAVRDGRTWKQSDRMYRENPSSRPEGYVSLNEHEYGIKYHRCNGDNADIEEKMHRIVVDNERWLKP